MLWEREFHAHDMNQVCKELVDAWSNPELKVFVLRSGLDFYEVTDIAEYIKNLYQASFPHLGTPRAFAEDVQLGDRESQRSGQIWMEVRYDPRYPDAYRHSANAQPLHTDGSYIPNYTNSTLLACVSNAGIGGETTFIDLSDLLNCLSHEAQPLLEQLMTVYVPHARSGDRRDTKILHQLGSTEKIYWNYYCVAKDADEKAKSVADSFFNYLASSQLVRRKTLAVKLSTGDAVMWKDDELLHGRNSFKASSTSERFIWKCALDVGVF
jgi:alpha-ketoglutarate-dependent taurine dioxygenase